MAKAETGTPRAPRGTKPVSVAFFSALDAAPEAQRAAIARAAQVMIRDQLRIRREKAKLVSDRARANGKAQPAANAAPARQVAVPTQAERSAGSALSSSTAGKSATAKGKAASTASPKATAPKHAAKHAAAAKAPVSKAAKATQPSADEAKAEPQPDAAKRTIRRTAKPAAVIE